MTQEARYWSNGAMWCGQQMANDRKHKSGRTCARPIMHPGPHRSQRVAEFPVIGYCEDCGSAQELPSFKSGIWWAGWCLRCVGNHSWAEKTERIADRRPE